MNTEDKTALVQNDLAPPRLVQQWIYGHDEWVDGLRRRFAKNIAVVPSVPDATIIFKIFNRVGLTADQVVAPDDEDPTYHPLVEAGMMAARAAIARRHAAPATGLVTFFRREVAKADLLGGESTLVDNKTYADYLDEAEAHYAMLEETAPWKIKSHDFSDHKLSPCQRESIHIATVLDFYARHFKEQMDVCTRYNQTRDTWIEGYMACADALGNKNPEAFIDAYAKKVVQDGKEETLRKLHERPVHIYEWAPMEPLVCVTLPHRNGVPGRSFIKRDIVDNFVKGFEQSAQWNKEKMFKTTERNRLEARRDVVKDMTGNPEVRKYIAAVANQRYILKSGIIERLDQLVERSPGTAIASHSRP